MNRSRWRSSRATSAARTSSSRRWLSWGREMLEARLREEICELGRSLFQRGLTHGSTGNISARCADGWLLTPTGSSLGGLDPDALLPPLTAYYVMRIGTLPLVPYYAPGDLALAGAVRGYARRHQARRL